MDILNFEMKLIKGMYQEVDEMQIEYMHKELPIREEVPFNIEHHIARYQVYRELLEDINNEVALKVDSECSSVINMMHDYIDNFIEDIKK